MWTVFWLKPFVIYLSRKGVVAAQPSNELLPGSGAGAGAGGGEERVMVHRKAAVEAAGTLSNPPPIRRVPNLRVRWLAHILRLTKFF